jgi:serine protease AprX
VLLRHGQNAFHAGVQSVWPLDAETAYGAIPTPLRLHADPRYTGRGITVAFVDAGFFPHPDLVEPVNRICAWADASEPDIAHREFGPSDLPRWPGWDAQAAGQWHGLMTTTAACGNATLSRGFYRGLAPDARVVLVQVADGSGHIGNPAIARALRWLGDNASRLGIGVVSISLGGDAVPMDRDNEVDREVAALVDRGFVVIAAAGNNGERRLVPPASAPAAITVGGLDDRNEFGHEAWQLWHSNYGETAGRAPKPELVAPSLHVVAPILPGSMLAAEAPALFARRGDPAIEAELSARKLVTPHYQHVEGTSFAAPWAAGLAALLRERFPKLTAAQIVDRILATARRPAGGRATLQLGRGVIDPVAALTAVPDVLRPGTQPAATAGLHGTAARPASTPPGGLFGPLAAAAVLAACCAAVAGRLRRRPFR